MKRLALTLTAVSVALSGCANMIGVAKDVDASTAAKEAEVASRLANVASNVPEGGRLLNTTIIHGAWVGAKKVSADASPDLPEAFNEDVTLQFPGRANMSTVAERITEVTGIPVKLAPDIYISTSALAPKGGGSQSSRTSPAGAGAGAAPVVGGVAAPMPMLPPAPGSESLSAASVNADYDSNLSLKFTGKLARLLDTICAKTGTNWEYKNGAIVLSRLMTKTFTVRSTPGSSQLNASVGKSGTGSGSSGSNFSSDSLIKMNSAFSVWDSLRDSLQSMTTGIGKYAISEATGTVTVTDTREVVEQVSKLVSDVNRSMNKMVAFRVEVISVNTSQSADYGIDWNAVFNKVAAANPSWKLTFGSPSSLASSDAASLGYQILTKGGEENGRSALSGSAAMIAALGGKTKASIVTTASALTLNRQPVPVAITDQTGYVQSVSVQQNTGTTGSTAGAAPVVQITPGVVTTGFILNLLPAVSEDNGVTLHFSIDISSLKKLNSFGSGTATVQNPEVSAMQFMQRVSMKNGETLILSGYERTAGQYDRRSLTQDADLLFGGSLSGTKARESIIILVTPVVSEGS